LFGLAKVPTDERADSEIKRSCDNGPIHPSSPNQSMRRGRAYVIRPDMGHAENFANYNIVAVERGSELGAFGRALPYRQRGAACLLIVRAISGAGSRREKSHRCVRHEALTPRGFCGVRSHFSSVRSRNRQSLAT